MKQELAKYFVNPENHYKKYGSDEFTTATRFTYTAIGSAINDSADVLIIKENHFVWTKEGEQVGYFLGPKAIMPDPLYPQVFKIMQERDSILRKYTKITTDNPKEMFVSIVGLKDEAMQNTTLSELSPGLWHWQAPHPDWRPGEPWDPHVSSYAVDNGDHLLLFDPQGVPNELLELVPDRKTAIVLTCPWHERDSHSLVERFSIPVYTPLPDTTQDIMRKFNVSAEQAGDGAPDLIWLLREKQGEAHPFKPGDHLPFGIDVFEGQWHNDTVLWIESHNAVICGDTLVDFGNGLEINLRWRPDAHAQIMERLHGLLDLPVEHLLATHGGPMDRTTLEKAIS